MIYTLQHTEIKINHKPHVNLKLLKLLEENKKQIFVTWVKWRFCKVKRKCVNKIQQIKNFCSSKDTFKRMGSNEPEESICEAYLLKAL